MTESASTTTTTIGERQRTPYSFPEFYRPSLVYPDVPFPEMLARTVQRVSERPAIYWRDVTVTYRELYGLVRSAAVGLHALGLRKGDRVCLLMSNRPEFVITWLAASMLGLVLSPMNPSYKEREVAYQLENSGATAVVVQRELLPLVQAAWERLPELKHVLVTGSEPVPGDARVVLFGHLLRTSPTSPVPSVEVSGDDLLALPYSSGTTGLPKGVMLTHRNLVVNYTQFIAASRVTEQDVFLVFLPLYHIYGVALLGQAMFSGAALALMERFDAAEVLRIVRAWGDALPAGAAGAAGAGRHAEPEPGAVPEGALHAERRRADAARSRRAGDSGDGHPGAPGVRHDRGVAADASQSHRAGAHPRGVWRDARLRHTAEGGGLESGERELPVGEVGEMCVRGPQVMRGYWQAEAETARVLRGGWYHTGDVGYMDEQGFVYIVDRAKEMIKYKAFGIAPAELEAVLLEHPAVRECAVVGWPDAEAGEIPRAYVALREGQSASDADLMAFANGKLANYKAIRQVVFVESIPKTASGKILRRQFKERAQQG